MRVRFANFTRPYLVAVSVDGPTESKHRYADGSLCMWSPDDGPDLQWRPEKALTALGLAELLLAGNDAEQAEAQPHLDFAIAELQEMKMQPALERALANKGLLKA